MSSNKKVKYNFFEELDCLEKENGVQGEELLEKIVSGIEKAVRKEYHDCDNIQVVVNREKQDFSVWVVKKVVEGEPENGNEINIEEALKYKKTAKVGKDIKIKVALQSLKRATADIAKQSIRGDIRNFEREKLAAQFKDKLKDIVSATVVKNDPISGIVTLRADKSELLLFKNEQIPGETLREGDIVKVYVVEIRTSEKKHPAVKISRTHKDLVTRLFELEVPEIYDGTVEIKSVSREAGSRTKIAVWSKDANVDAVGACIGPKRSRISKVVEELGGEKIDIIVYSEDEEEFIAKALAPADVISVSTYETENEKGEMIKGCTVVVPNTQLSLAIGNKGQNAKLAAKLTGYKIDIKPETPIV